MNSLKNKNSKQIFCGVLFMVILLCVPMLAEIGQSVNAVEIYANQKGYKELGSAGIAFGAGYAIVNTLGLLCVVQAIVGIVAVA